MALLFPWFISLSSTRFTASQEVRRPTSETVTTLTCPAAYTTYAFFEWALILFDVGFDAVTALDFSTFDIVVRDVKGVSKGYVQWLPK